MYDTHGVTRMQQGKDNSPIYALLSVRVKIDTEELRRGGKTRSSVS